MMRERHLYIISLVNIILFYADLTTQYSIFATEQEVLSKEVGNIIGWK